MIKTRLYLFVFVGVMCISGCTADESTCPDTNCADYASQAEAQAAYDANPECHGDLDADNDGTACEKGTSGSGNSGCPTTANCGCSGRNKSECEGPCCKWVTGSGCECS